MNVELFEEHKHELEKMIELFFLAHPDILKPDESFELSIIPTKRFIAKTGQVDLKIILDIDTEKIIPKGVPFYSTRVRGVLYNANKPKIRDVVQMTQDEFLRYRNSGRGCLRRLEEWLSKYDNRLSLGMKL